jgi:hypothetical protein
MHKRKGHVSSLMHKRKGHVSSLMHKRKGRLNMIIHTHAKNTQEHLYAHNKISTNTYVHVDTNTHARRVADNIYKGKEGEEVFEQVSLHFLLCPHCACVCILEVCFQSYLLLK